MKELRALYAVAPIKTMQQRFSTPLPWRRTSNSSNNGSSSNSNSIYSRDSRMSTKSRCSVRRSSLGTIRSSYSSSNSSSSRGACSLATRRALEASTGIGEFEVLDVLGRGTFGVVKLARHVATGHAVAIKILAKDMIVEMRQEKNILREQTVHLLLDHVFVSRLYATFQDVDALYFVMEYCPGGEVYSLVYDPQEEDEDDSTGDDAFNAFDEREEDAENNKPTDDVEEKPVTAAMAGAVVDDQDGSHDDDMTGTTDSESEDDAHQQEQLRRARALKLELFLGNQRAKKALRSTHGGLLEQHAAFYLACLMVGLEYLHEMNILYRDLKLENLVLDTEGYPKLIDFGLSKPDAASHTKNRTMCGSMEYMAPEVLQRLPYDQRADMWSFGILMFELLCGATPFYHTNRREQGRRITCEPVLFTNHFEDECPAACELISALLSKNPVERPRSFAQVRESAFFKKYFPTPQSWQQLLARQHAAPFVPKLDGPFDTSLFVKAVSYEDEGDDLYGY
ncbi:Agc protein kinase, partial [Globisporangium splendens]